MSIYGYKSKKQNFKIHEGKTYPLTIIKTNQMRTKEAILNCIHKDLYSIAKDY